MEQTNRTEIQKKKVQETIHVKQTTAAFSSHFHHYITVFLHFVMHVFCVLRYLRTGFCELS